MVGGACLDSIWRMIWRGASDKMSTSFPRLFLSCCSNAFAHGMYMKRSELWVKHNLSNVYIIYALDLASIRLAQSDRTVQSTRMQICRS